jgi:hypothetical protein
MLLLLQSCEQTKASNRALPVGGRQSMQRSLGLSPRIKVVVRDRNTRRM